MALASFTFPSLLHATPPRGQPKLINSQIDRAASKQLRATLRQAQLWAFSSQYSQGGHGAPAP